MNRISLYIIVLAILTLSSCKKKEEQKDIIVPAPVEEVVSGPQKMSETRQRHEVEWQGDKYVITIVRSADDSLPLVSDESGQEYYDNTINLVIQREDSTTFFKRTFKKADFVSYARGSGMEKTGALLGIVYDKMENGRLVFATSIGSSDFRSDEFVPMIMTLDRNGNTTVTLDTKLDSDTDEGGITGDEEA